MTMGTHTRSRRDCVTIVFTAARTGLSGGQGEERREFGDQTIWLAGVNGEAPRRLAEGERPRDSPM